MQPMSAECAVCGDWFAPQEQLAETDCGHVFHAKCLHHCMQREPSSTVCALCGQSIQPIQPSQIVQRQQQPPDSSTEHRVYENQPFYDHRDANGVTHDLERENGRLQRELRQARQHSAAVTEQCQLLQAQVYHSQHGDSAGERSALIERARQLEAANARLRRQYMQTLTENASLTRELHSARQQGDWLSTRLRQAHTYIRRLTGSTSPVPENQAACETSSLPDDQAAIETSGCSSEHPHFNSRDCSPHQQWDHVHPPLQTSFFTRSKNLFRSLRNSRRGADSRSQFYPTVSADI